MHFMLEYIENVIYMLNLRVDSFYVITDNSFIGLEYVFYFMRYT